MSLLSVFLENRTQPIGFEEFRDSLGWSENDYLTYLSYIDRLRSVCILFPTSNNYTRKELAALLKFLQKFDSRELNIAENWMYRVSRFCPPVNAYNTNWERCEARTLTDTINPYITYPSLHDFRLEMENLIADELYNYHQSTVVVTGFTYSEASQRIKELKKLAREHDIPVDYELLPQLNAYTELSIEELEALAGGQYPLPRPTSSININDYESICTWSKAWQEYYDRCSELSEISSSELQDYIQQRKENPFFNNQTNILYIYRGTIDCHRNRHNIISATAQVPTVDYDYVNLNVRYCMECNMFLLSHTEYQEYRKRYRLIYVHFKGYRGKGSNSYSGSLESPLKLSGYNVGQADNFYDTQRQSILRYIIANNILSKEQVLHYISTFITINGAKEENALAVEKWTRDLQYVQEYNSNNQPKAHISKILKY